MKTLYAFIITVVVLGCGQNSNEKKTAYLPDSVGGINGLQVVIAEDLWRGPVGDTIRSIFASPVPGLPQEEPLFTLNHLPLTQFSDFARTYRNVLHVALAETDTLAMRKNAYAQPQIIAFVQGKEPQDLIQALVEQKTTLIQTFLIQEIKERQRRTMISPLAIAGLTRDFGVELNIPSAYHIAAESSAYYWLRKELKANGSTNIFIYEAPLESFPEGTNPAIAMQHIRDSIGAMLLPVEDGSKFITDSNYQLHTESTTIEDRMCYVTKGLWTIDDAFMAGPFVTFAIRDETRERYLILEGFTYAPSMSKRDLQFELESILRTVRFLD